ncbi:MAG: radical SAM protein [Clostridia bacterium]|nr:radical SAM protein [Clostridia bacterium]
MTDPARPVLDYLEIEITEYCNLNCRGCCDFSNLVKEKKIYELEEFVKDFQRLAELFSGVDKIRLMGGEPLLNPHLTDYVRICRDIFPKTDLRIVTNGLLIPRLSDETLQTIKEYDCRFDISNYPPTRKMFPQIKERLEPFEVEYDLGFPMNCFVRTILEHPSDDPAPAFRNCIFTHCHMLSHGKLSPCSYAHCIGRLNAEYGLSFPETDCVDIYSDITGGEIIRRFTKPHEFCKCCGRGAVPYKWQGGVKSDKADKYDWLIKDSFLNTAVAPVAQSVLKTPAKLLRSIIQKRNWK